MVHRKRPRVALATCRQLPEPDPDQDLLLAALRAADVDAEMLAWDDSHVAGEPFRAIEPGAFDLCVIRSTWNYYHDWAAFRAWLEHAAQATILANPVNVLCWNLHKRYLAELARRDVPTVPTAWVERGSNVRLEALMHGNGWSDVVIKPAISAGSYRTRRFRSAQAAEGQAFLDALAADGDVMVQRYMPAIERGGGGGGERALVWIDGEFTHAVHKSPRFSDGVERVSEASRLSDGERHFGEGVLSRVPDGDGLLYARVDLIPGDDGTPRLSELELIEPSLYLLQHPPALARFVSAIRERIGR